MNWLRLYHGTCADPKLSLARAHCGLPRPYVIAAWIAALEHASSREDRGSLDGLTPELLAVTIDCTIADATSLLEAFDRACLTRGSRIVAWEKRQPRSDDVRTRVRRYREKNAKTENQRETLQTGDVTLQGADVTLRSQDETIPTRARGSSEQNRTEKKDSPSNEGVSKTPVADAPSSAGADPPPLLPSVNGHGDILQEAMRTWIEVCGDLLGKPRKLTPQRRTALSKRLREDFGGSLEQWRRYCETIRASPFLTGDNDRGWTADFDWVLKPANCVKILEGRYPANPPKRAGNGSTSYAEETSIIGAHERLMAKLRQTEDLEDDDGAIEHRAHRRLAH